MTSLQGYLKTDYQTLLKAFGKPTYDTPSGDEKVNTEWRLPTPYGEATIYDWKDYDKGTRSRSGESYQWHIGGNNINVVGWLTYQLHQKSMKE